MPRFVSMFGEDRSRWDELKKFEITEQSIEDLIGPYEVATALSGDVICIPVAPQKEKTGLINSIISSILGQKVWGDCVQLSEKESHLIGKNRR
jgi:hypothetical protein